MSDLPFPHFVPLLPYTAFCLVCLTLYFPQQDSTNQLPDPLQYLERGIVASRRQRAIRQYAAWESVERILKSREEHVWWTFPCPSRSEFGLGFD